MGKGPYNRALTLYHRDSGPYNRDEGCFSSEVHSSAIPTNFGVPLFFYLLVFFYIDRDSMLLWASKLAREELGRRWVADSSGGVSGLGLRGGLLCNSLKLQQLLDVSLNFISIFLDECFGFEPAVHLKGQSLRALLNETRISALILNIEMLASELMMVTHTILCLPFFVHFCVFFFCKFMGNCKYMGCRFDYFSSEEGLHGA